MSINISQIEKEFYKKSANYSLLGKNLLESFNVLFEQENIDTLQLKYRIKGIESFIEKIERKSYSNPFQEVEDICGIRIICYYKKDILRIKEILTKELEIHESSDKEQNLKFDQFGYRSHHLIASIKEDWNSIPQYRDLANLKCEIQIRTVLMHAWAEIEHSLAYKSDVQTPSRFRRKIHLISAMLEISDSQFEELKIESERYKADLLCEIESSVERELNLDTLQVFMDNNFPKRRKDLNATGQLLNQMIQYGVTLEELKKAWGVVKEDFREIERDFWSNRNSKHTMWIQAGIGRFVLDISHPKFIKRLSGRMQIEEREKYRKKYFPD